MLAVVSLLALLLPRTGAAQATAPAFTQTACDLPKLTPDILPRLRCGTVSVPRDESHPGAAQFKLAVVVIGSAQQPSRPDPLLYISGGPGSPLTVYTYAQALHPFGPDRDLILVDQRGTGRSEPQLCPDLDRAFVPAMLTLATEPEAVGLARKRSVFEACRTQAVARGIDLAEFGTSVTVADLERVRRALGVAQWNVFGVSYGTTVAMTLMAHHPETLRSAVLDSVNPPDPVLPPWSANVAAAREAFFAAANVPGLADLYQDTIQRLERSPLGLAHPVAGQTRLTAALFELLVGHLVYYRPFYAALPRLIATVHDGDASLVTASLADVVAAALDPAFGGRISANVAIDCRDRPRFHGAAPGADIFDRAALYGICDGWGDLGPAPVIPTGTPVPTLVLAGQFDPNAPPAISHHVADLIGSQARWVEFPLVGHSVRSTSPCAASIVAAFVDHPDAELDTACARQPSPVHFLPLARAP